MEFLENVSAAANTAITELLDHAQLEEGKIVVIGCSTSEVLGEHIGKASSEDVAKAVMDGVYGEIKRRGLYLAVQCCEHLNRALVVESECADKYGWDKLTLVPWLHAGGAFATLAYERFDNAVTVENIVAHAGMDIGDTFIGMHLKAVAVPFRGSLKEIGMAHVTMATTRARFIGGERARYKK